MNRALTIRSRRRIFCAMLAVTPLSAALWADTAELLPAATLKRITSGEVLFADLQAEDALSLLPNSPSAKGILASRATLAPQYTFEMLAQIKLPAPLKKLDKDKRDLAIYNRIRAVSTLKGIKYFSETFNKERVLYDECFRISQPGSRAPLPDSLVTAIPKDASFYVHERDASFGDGDMRLGYRYENGEMVMTLTSVDGMHLGPIYAIEPENMKMTMVIQCGADSLIGYAVVSARTMPVPPFVSKIAKDAAINRLKALFSWFKSSMESYSA
jgi:hypothetical protein